MKSIPQIDREPNTEVMTSATRTSSIELDTAAAPLLNFQILAPTFSEAHSSIRTAPNYPELIIFVGFNYSL